MAMHKTNSLLKYIAIPTIGILILVAVLSVSHKKSPTPKNEIVIKNTASNDSAAESLDTLTADLSKTKQKIVDVAKDNEVLKQQNTSLLNSINTKHSEEASQLTTEIQNLKTQIQSLGQKDSLSVEAFSVNQPITIVDDLSRPPKSVTSGLAGEVPTNKLTEKKPEIIPYYTIPANGTSVQDKLMTALVGRIPIKGVVTDPYPFKIVISDNNLAANGLRIPHLLKMIVSGYCEGDLNLVSVRGWITSLTFVFDDGTISSTTSNDNDIGNFTKSNSLGHLSDKYGNPFIRGKLITNAPSYLAGNVALGAGVGAANAYTQSQTTTNSYQGNTESTVTGSQGKYVAGQAMSNASSEVQQWWRDRQEQSFDAVYVAPADEEGEYIQIAVNFAKEIHIDYDTKGRKLNYAHPNKVHFTESLD